MTNAGHQQGLAGLSVSQKCRPVRGHPAVGMTFSSAILTDNLLKEDAEVSPTYVHYSHRPLLSLCPSSQV